MYAGETELAAFSEVLPYAPAVPPIALSDLFDDISDDDLGTLPDAIENELPLYGGMPIGNVPLQWRTDRSIYRLKLPDDGWFIDIAHSLSIAALNSLCRDDIVAVGLNRVTLSELTQDVHLGLTTALADRLFAVVLDDGSFPRGIVYPSKWGTDLRDWAIWLRTSGRRPEMDATVCIGQQLVERSNPALQQAARRNGLVIH